MKLPFIKKLRNDFVKNVVIMVSGAAGAQLITIAFTPLITRLYGPDAFGLAGAFVAFITVISQVASLAYPIAIVLPKIDSKSWCVTQLSIICALTVVVGVAVFTILFGEWYFSILKMDGLIEYSLLVPLAVFFIALHQAYTQWLVRKNEFKIIAKSSMIHAAVVNLSKSIAGMVHSTGVSLVVITVAGHVLNAAILWCAIKKTSSKRIFGDISFKRIRCVARNYRDFPLYRAPQLFFNALSQSFPVLFITTVYGISTVGLYSLAVTAMSAPITLLGKSVTSVFYPRFVEAHRENNNMSLMLAKSTLAMFVISIIPFSIVVFFGPKLFFIVFGSEWAGAGEYAQWLVLFLLSGFINRPCVAAIAALDLQKLFLAFELITIVVRISAMYLAFYLFHDDMYVVAFYSVAGTIANFVLIWYVIGHTASRNKNYCV